MISLIIYCFSFQKRETEFSDYMRNKLNQAKNEFWDLLKETHVIDHRLVNSLAFSGGDLDSAVGLQIYEASPTQVLKCCRALLI